MLLSIVTALKGLDQRLLYTLTVSVLAAGLLLFWRLCRFTLLPMMRPDEPKELPYWLPCRCSSEQDFLSRHIYLNLSNTLSQS